MLNSFTAADLLSRLWQISWQSAVIAILVLSLRLAFGGTITGRWRHALWLLVLCRLLMPALPESRVSLFGLPDIFARMSPTRSAVQEPSPTFTVTLSNAARKTVDADAVTTNVTDPRAANHNTVPLFRQPVIGFAIWLSVAIFLTARLALVNLRFQRELRNCCEPVDRQLSALLEKCHRDMGFQRFQPMLGTFKFQKLRFLEFRTSSARAGGPCHEGAFHARWYPVPQLIITDLIDAPAVCGIFRPRVLLPTQLANTLSDAQLRLIFLHELAHIKCGDIAMDWLWAILQSLHWFNPVLWLIAPVRRNDRELARDEMVLALTGPGHADRYGQTLLELAQPVRLPLFCPGLVGMSTGKKHLQRRIQMIARFNGQRIGSTWTGLTLLVITACCALTTPRPNQAATTAPAISASQPTTNITVSNGDDPDDHPSPADVVTQALLDRLLPELRLNQNALSDVIDFLRQVSGANFYVDWPALQRAGIARDSAVSVRVKNIKLSKALELIFKSVDGDDDAHKLAYVLDDGVITISTIKELNKSVVTRRYDINDLLFIPVHAAADSHAFDSDAEKQARRTARVEEIKQFIQATVDPTSWKDRGGELGTISSGPLRAVLLVTQTPNTQRKVRAALEQLRASSDRQQISIETRLIIVDDTELEKLPDALRKLAKPPHPASQLLTATEREAVMKAIQGIANLTPVTAPRITIFNGQQGTLEAKYDQPYIRSYSTQIKKTADTVTTTYEPDIQQAKVGLKLETSAKLEEGKDTLLVTSLPTFSQLAGFEREPWVGAPPEAQLFIQRPIFLTTFAGWTLPIPDRQTLLVRCSDFKETVDVSPQLTDFPAKPTVNDPAIAAAIERAHHRMVFMLVTPTILKQP